MKWSLPALALGRPVTTVMLVLSLAGLGAIAYTRIPLEFLSSADFPILSCWIPYPGAVPAQVEKEIAISAEGVFLTVPKVRSIRSWSRADGCFVFMEFDWETDMALATAEVRDRIERLKLELPTDVEHLYLRRYSQEESSILWLGMFSKKDQDETLRLARTELRPRLARLDGVAEVEVFGGDVAQVYIEFDQNALRSLNLGLYEIIAGLRESSLNLSVGKLREGRAKYLVRALGEFTDTRQLEELIIGRGGVRVKDVATVSMRRPEEDWTFSMDGRRGAFISVKKESQANTVDTCRSVLEAVERLRQDPLFAGFEIRVFEDISERITATLGSLVDAGKYGGALALAVLFVFLLRVRATVLVALTIPASLVGAVVYMYFAGLSFNVVTMSAMIVSVGMLVDNSIVVIENIFRHRQSNPDAVSCALEGASEVGLAITTATLTTLVVFIPVIYMQMGMMSVYMRQFAQPISIALISSLVLALSVVPLAASHIFRSDPREHPVMKRLLPLGGRVQRLAGSLSALRPFERVKACHGRALGFTLRHRLPVILLAAGLTAATYFVPFKQVGMQQMPTLDTRQVRSYIRFERFNKEEADKIFQELTDAVNASREELGIENIYVSYSPRGGMIRAHLRDPRHMPAGESPPYSTEEVRDILAERFPDRIPGAELHFEIPKAGQLDTQSVTLSLRGDDAEVVSEYAERFKEMLRTLPDIVDAKTDRESDDTEVRLQIDEALASQAGISAMAVAQTVGFALRGTRLPYLKREGREVEVWAQFQDADRSTQEDLNNVAMLTADGELIPLKQLIKTHKGLSARTLRREGGKSVTQVIAEVSTKDLAAVSQAIEGLKASFALPHGYSIDRGTVLEELEESEDNFRGALILAVILMYLLMAALFESCLLPLSILTTVPLAFVGVYWSMYLTDTPLDSVSLIGAILMCGIIVNNGIVIVDHINQLRRRKGLQRTAAILQSGRDRLRPVLMTAMTTVLGCVPLAIGSGSGYDMLYSMGRALVGGLTMGTLLTLFVVPLFYSLIDDVQVWLLDYLGALAGLRARAPGAATAAASCRNPS